MNKTSNNSIFAKFGFSVGSQRILLALLTFLFCFFVYPKLTSVAEGDPDRFFHFSISKIYAEEGLPEKIPQIVGIGWDKLFAEKEFLFHVFTGMAYKINGETGVESFIQVLFSLILSSLVWIGMRESKSAFSGAIASWIIIAMSTYFALRMLYIRPHVLAVFIYIWALWAIMNKRMMMFFLLSFFYCLAYHTFYIVIILYTVASMACYIATSSKPSLREIGMFAAAVFSGIIINPYFPSNIILSFTHLKIALQSTTLPLQYFGTELMPLRSDILFKMLGLQVISIIAFGLIYVVHKAQAKKNVLGPSSYKYIFTFGLCALWSILLMISPRASEYLVPTFLIFTCCMLNLPTRIKMLVWAALVIIFLGNFRNQAAMYVTTWDKEVTLASDYGTALASIPTKVSNDIVFNCGWSYSPFIFYFRPDLKFIDLLDPTFLQTYDSNLSKEKWQIYNGEIPDVAYHISRDFKSEYVLCDNTVLTRLLIQDPDTKLLYPKIKSDFHDVYIFQLPQKLFSNYYLNLKVEVATANNTENLDSLNALSFTSLPEVKKQPAPQQRFQYLFGLLNDANEEKQFKMSKPKADLCMHLLIPKDIRSRIDEETLLGLGYNGRIEVDLNKQAIYRSIESERAQIVNKYFRFRRDQLRDKDLDIYICAPYLNESNGYSISLHSTKEVKDSCLKKFAWKFPSNDYRNGQMLSDLRAETCGVEIVNYSYQREPESISEGHP